MCAKVGYCIENLFSLATRQRCMSKLKSTAVPAYGKTPTTAAAVLVPLCRIEGVPSLLYTVRSFALKTDSGQISFPGGKLNAEETSVEAALRETKEEIGLSADKIDIWGHGPALPGRDRKISITPVIGSIEDLQQSDLAINEKEVAQVFAVSIEILCNADNQYYTQFSNGFILPVFVAEDYKIWGLTAFITHIFLSCALSQDVYKNEWRNKKITLT